MTHRDDIEGSSSLVWLITGAAIGAVLGVLFAPKAGQELRSNLGDAARDMGERSKGLVGRISDRIPARVKAAAGFGAIRAGGREAIREAKDRIEDRLS